MRDLPMSWCLLLLGGIYGGFLTVLGIAGAGAGHGTYVIIGVSSSPLGLTQSTILCIFAPVFLWAAVGFLLGLIEYAVCRKILLAVMFAHYAALPIILGQRSKFGDWGYVHREPQFVAASFALYGVGQLVILGVFAVLLNYPQNWVVKGSTEESVTQGQIDQARKENSEKLKKTVLTAGLAWLLLLVWFAILWIPIRDMLLATKPFP